MGRQSSSDALGGWPSSSASAEDKAPALPLPASGSSAAAKAVYRAMTTAAGVLPSACHADLAPSHKRQSRGRCARLILIIALHPQFDLAMQASGLASGAWLPSCSQGMRVAHHLERALRFQMAGRAAVQGPSVACLYRPYNSSLACTHHGLQCCYQPSVPHSML